MGYGTPGNSAVGDTAAAGTSNDVPRLDHKHGREAFASSAADIGTSAGGSASTVSHGDHVHGVPATVTSYAPVLTAVTTNPTLGSGSIQSSSYNVLGDMLDYEGRIAFGTSGAAAGSGNYRISLPVNIAAHSAPIGQARIVDSSVSQIALADIYYVSATTASLVLTSGTLAAANNVSNSNPMTWAASDEINFRIRCRTA